MAQQHQGETGSKTVVIAVVAALLGALVVGVVVYLVGQNRIEDLEAQVAAARTSNQSVLNQVHDLQDQLTEAKAELEKRKGQLQHQKEAHQAAEDKLEAETSTDLDDGRYITHIDAVDATSDPQTITVDVMQWFTGDAANKAAKQDGMETPVPNDYYVRNESKQLRTLDVAPGTDAEVLYWHKDMFPEGKSVSLETFANVMSGSAGWQEINQNGLYWITLEDGVVTAIEVQYVP